MSRADLIESAAQVAYLWENPDSSWDSVNLTEHTRDEYRQMVAAVLDHVLGAQTPEVYWRGYGSRWHILGTDGHFSLCGNYTDREARRNVPIQDVCKSCLKSWRSS